MKKKGWYLLIACFLVITMVAVGCGPSDTPEPPANGEEPGNGEDTPPSSEAEGFLARIPEIQNREPIHVALEAGGSADLIIPYIKKFSEATGIEVTTESMVMTVIYPKLNTELIAGTGAYDITVVEASTTNEWAPYLWTMQELAEQFEPGGVDAFLEDIKGIHPVVLRQASDVDGNIKGLPYYTYHQVAFYRKDVWEHPDEQAAFKEKYGYDLAVPTTWQEVHDQAEFFTRKKGDLLKGEPLAEDLYGVGIMAGQYEINDEIATRIWSYDRDYVSLVRDADGKPKEFVITKEDREALKKSLEEYCALLPYASPGCLTGFWDFISAQFAAGLTVQMPHLYVSMDQFCFTVEDEVPGAELGLIPPVGGRGYTGAFHQAVAKASKNPEAAYWLARYISSYETQRDMIEEGWSGVRMDVYNDPKYEAEEWRTRVGARAEAIRQAWDLPGLYEKVNDLFFFNSDAAGKVYEEQIVLLHQAAAGEKTIDQVVDELISVTIDLQTKHGSLPIREE